MNVFDGIFAVCNYRLYVFSEDGTWLIMGLAIGVSSLGPLVYV